MLIPLYYTIPDYVDVNPNWVTQILQGTVLTTTTVGTNTYVAAATATSTVLGLAGDTLSNTTAGIPYAANVVIGSTGTIASPNANVRSTENRVSDLFNETIASGKMTVYHGGGRFADDQYDTTQSYSTGQKLYSNASGLVTNVSGGGDRIGTVILTPQAYPSGVPGTGTASGSTSLGTFLTFSLII